MKTPLILLVGGLGISKSVLKQYGISRLNNDCDFNPGALDKKSERKILKKYMTKKGGIHEKNPIFNHWIHTMVTETQGWPHHSTNYGNVLSEYLNEGNKVLDDKGLKFIVKQGIKKRFKYDQRRVEDFDIEERRFIASLLQKKKSQQSKNDIISFFQSTWNHQQSKELFDMALEKGVFHQKEEGAYVVPIPSMQTWILDRFGDRDGDENRPKIKKSVLDSK